MGKISVFLKRYFDVGLLYIFYIINFIIGGVFVSFVLVGDINLSEFKVLIGFVGRCVIE